MQDFIVALGLVFVIEGAIWALFPQYLTRMLEAAKEMPEQYLRFTGIGAVILGALVVWFVKG